MMAAKYRQLSKGLYSPVMYNTDYGYLVKPLELVPSSANKVIIGCHGRGGTGYMYGQYPAMAHVDALVDLGYSVLGIDHARVNSWGDPDAMRAMDDAYSFLQGLGYTATQIGLMGWSMGGQTCLNWAKRNASKVACGWLWNPVTDLRWFRDTVAAGYTAPYSSGSATQAPTGWPAEINATYAAASAAVGTATIPANTGGTVTLNITTNTGKSFADGNNNAVIGKPQATVNGVAFTYTGKTDSSLTGCQSTTGSSISVTNGMAISSAYATQSNGYRVRDEATIWNGLGPKFMISQASDDTVVAPGMNTDATFGFPALVGNSASVALRSPNPTGGHIDSIAQVPTSEVTAFYVANLPTAA